MKKLTQVLLVSGLWLACFTPAFADTLVTAPIATSTEWTLSGSPYTVSSPATSVNINSGATLTVDPGVVVNGTIQVGGNLIASGTPAMPVTINGRINASFGPATTTLSHTIVNGSLFAYFVTLNLFDVAFHVATSSPSHPIIVDGCHFTHASTTIDGSTENGYEMTLADLPTGEVWSADNPPYIVVDGDTLTKHLVINPGAVIKFLTTNFTRILTGGNFDVQGSTSSPVYLTSIKDDSVGGDTNGDGSASVPGRGDWMGIQVEGGTAQLNNVALYYANTAINILNASGTPVVGSSVTIASSTLAIGGNYGSLASSSLINSVIVGNGAGLRGCEQITVTNSVIAGNATGTISCSTSHADLRNNWWGNASGPYNATLNPTGTGDSVANDGTLYSPWLTSDPRNPAPSCISNCNSSVIFLPGIEATRLFTTSGSGDQKLWEPSVTTDVGQLSLNSSGQPINVDTYTKTGQIIDAAYGTYNIYSSFIGQMNTLKTSGSIADWEPIAYDWRYDYNTLLSGGKMLDQGRIYYGGPFAATSTPYIVQELKRLAANSRTHKVTIIAHSNGGLLAKALLMQPGIAQYIDKVIMVATPQLGTPAAVGALLNGIDQSIPTNDFPLTLNPATARDLAQNMPSTYNLLPSTNYFTYTDNPVITFDNASLPSWASHYLDPLHPEAGIHSTTLLQNFMTDNSGFRPTPSFGDTGTPQIVSSALFASSTSTHNSLDGWTPPSGVQLITIAGWGNETLAGIQYEKEVSGCVFAGSSGCTVPIYNGPITYTPKTVIDGDGTVVVSSALWGNGATSTRYWIDLRQYNIDHPIQTVEGKLSLSHPNILEVPTLRTLIGNIVTNSTSSLPQYITTTQPTYNGSTPRLHYILHSPLTLGFTDSSGNYTGSTATTTVFNAPGVDYQRFGEVQWLSVPASTTGQVIMRGTGSGSFALDVQSVNGNTLVATTTFAAVPSSTSTVATINLTVTSSPTASSTLLVDQDGNGTVDLTLQASQNSIVTPPAPPTIALVATTTSTFTVHYTNMPANSVLAFADVSHHVEGGYRTPIIAGGSGTTTIVAYGLPAGFTSIMALATTTATTSLAETSQFYLYGTASPVVIYVSADVTGQTVTVTYNRIPSNNELVFVNTTTGTVVPGYATTATAGSAGTTTISTAGITPYGQYYLRARDATTHTTPTYAQTVNFYISDPNGGDGL